MIFNQPPQILQKNPQTPPAGYKGYQSVVELCSASSTTSTTVTYCWGRWTYTSTEWASDFVVKLEFSAYTSASGGIAYVQLWNITDNVGVGDLMQITELWGANNATFQTKAIGKSSLISGKTYGIALYTNNATYTASLSSGRLVFEERFSNTPTSRITYIRNTRLSTSLSSTTYVEPVLYRFNYDASKWDGSPTFYLEGSIAAASTFTTYIHLYDVTAASAVSSSEISTTSTSTTVVRSAAITLVDGHEYAVRYKVSGGSTGSVANAHIVIKQTNPTKWQMHRLAHTTGVSHSSTSDQYSGLNWPYYQSEHQHTYIYGFKYEAYAYVANASATGSFHMTSRHNVTLGSGFIGTYATTSSTTRARISQSLTQQQILYVLSDPNRLISQAAKTSNSSYSFTVSDPTFILSISLPNTITTKDQLGVANIIGDTKQVIQGKSSIAITTNRSWKDGTYWEDGDTQYAIGSSQSNIARAIKFTPNKDAPLYWFGSGIGRVGIPDGSLYVSIYTDNAGVPGTEILRSATIHEPQDFGYSSYLDYYFNDDSVVLLSSESYWIVLTTDAPISSSSYYFIWGLVGDYNAAVPAVFDGTSWTTTPGIELGFATRYLTNPITGRARIKVSAEKTHSTSSHLRTSGQYYKSHTADSNKKKLNVTTGHTTDASPHKGKYWVGGTGDWTDPANWSTTSGGTGGAGMPTQYEDAIFDANSFSASNQIVSIGLETNPDVKTLDMSGVTQSGIKLTIYDFNASLSVFGDLRANSNITFDKESFSDGTIVMRGTGVIDLNGATINDLYLMVHTLYPTGTINIVSDIVSNFPFTIASGRVYSNNHTLSFSGIGVNYSDYIRELYLGSSTVYLGASGISSGISLDTSPGAKLDAGTSTIHFRGLGVTNIYGNITLYDIVSELDAGQSFTFGSGTMTFHNFTLNGAYGGRFISFQDSFDYYVTGTISVASGTLLTTVGEWGQANLHNLSGSPIVISNAQVQFTNVDGAGRWYKGAGFTDGGNNTGWYNLYTELTHTTSSFLRKQQTINHTTDSYKIVGVSTYTKTHTTDALKRVRITKTHSTDTLKRKQNTFSHTTNTNKKKSGLAVSHTTDSLKRKAVAITHTTGALLKRQISLTYTTNSLLRKTNSLTHSVNSLLRKQVLKTHTTDANKKKQNITVQHTTSSNKRKANQILIQTVDSLKRSQLLRTHTADILRHRTFTPSHTTGALLRKQNNSVHSTDAIKRATVLKTHTTGSNKRKSINPSHTTDTNKKKANNTLAHTTSALKRTQLVISHTTNALLRRQITKYHTADSYLRKAPNRTHTSDSNKKKANNTVIYTSDALKRTRGALNHTTDALLKIRIIKSHTTDLLKRIQVTKTHSTSSFLRKQATINHTANANKRKALAVTYTTDANKRKASPISHTTDTLKKTRITIAHISDALKKIRVPYNIIYNGDFELGSGSTTNGTSGTFSVPGWFSTTTNATIVSVDNTVSHSVAQSIKIVVDATNSNNGLKLANSNIMSVAPNTTYTFSIWTKSDTAGQLQIQFRNGSTTTTGNYYQGAGVWNSTATYFAINTTTSWSLATIAITTDASTTLLSISDLKRSGSATQANRTFWIDDISIYQNSWHTTDSLLRISGLATHSTSSLIRKYNYRIHTIDANKKKSGITISYTTDSNKKKANNGVNHTTNTLVRKMSVLSHSSDSFKRTELVKTHTTNSLLRRQTSLTHSTNILKRGRNALTQTVDSFKRGRLALIHTTDINKKRQNITILHQTDANKRKTQNATHQTSANKKRGLSVFHTIDANKRIAGVSITHTTNALKRGRYIAVHSTNTLLRQTKTLYGTTSSFIRKRIGLTFSTDSNRKKQNNLVIHKADAFIRGKNQVVHNTDSNKRKQIIRIHTTDSSKKIVSSIQHTTSSNLKSATLKTHSTNSVLRKAQTISHSTNAYKKVIYTRSHTTNAQLRRWASLQHTTAANKNARGYALHTTSTNKKKTNSVNHTTSALLRKQYTASHQIDSFIRKQYTAGHNTDINKKNGYVVSHISDALLSSSVSRSHFTNASIWNANGTKKVLIDGQWEYGIVKVLHNGEWRVIVVKYYTGTEWVLTAR